MSIKPINRFNYWWMGGILSIAARIRGQRIHSKVKIKGPAIVLGNHSSWFDFAYIYRAIYPTRATFIAAEKMFKEGNLGPFLKLARAIPKKMFDADPKAVMTMLRLLKAGEVVGMFPEGQISTTGHALSIGYAVVKMIKRSNVNVYVVRNEGAHLNYPAWAKKGFKGKFDTYIELLFTKSDLKILSEDEIFVQLKNALYFNPIDYNKFKSHPFKGGKLENLENLLYECPVCKSIGTKVEQMDLICPTCNARFHYDDYGYLGDKTVHEHYMNQSIRFEKKLEKNNQYALISNVKLISYVGDKLGHIGAGTLMLNPNGYHYTGTLNNEHIERHFEIKNVPAIPSDIGRDIQIYADNFYYQFDFDDPQMPTQFMLYGELLYSKIADSKDKHGSFM